MLLLLSSPDTEVLGLEPLKEACYSRACVDTRCMRDGLKPSDHLLRLLKVYTPRLMAVPDKIPAIHRASYSKIRHEESSHRLAAPRKEKTTKKKTEDLHLHPLSFLLLHSSCGLVACWTCSMGLPQASSRCLQQAAETRLESLLASQAVTWRPRRPPTLPPVD